MLRRLNVLQSVRDSQVLIIVIIEIIQISHRPPRNTTTIIVVISLALPKSRSLDITTGSILVAKQPALQPHEPVREDIVSRTGVRGPALVLRGVRSAHSQRHRSASGSKVALDGGSDCCLGGGVDLDMGGAPRDFEARDHVDGFPAGAVDLEIVLHALILQGLGQVRVVRVEVRGIQGVEPVRFKQCSQVAETEPATDPADELQAPCPEADLPGARLVNRRLPVGLLSGLDVRVSNRLDPGVWNHAFRVFGVRDQPSQDHPRAIRIDVPVRRWDVTRNEWSHLSGILLPYRG
jgi:hypothetical protein